MQTKHHADHYIICGYGNLGKEIADEFIAQKKFYVFIEKNKEKCKQLKNKSLPYVCGSAHERDTLIEAGIEGAKGIVITFSKDSEILYTVFAVKELVPDIDIVCRATRKETYKRLKELGVRKVLLLEELVAERIMASIENPSLVDSLNRLTKDDQKPLTIEEIVIDKGSCFSDKNFEILQEATISKASILGIRQASTGEVIYNPEPDTPVLFGDVLFVMGYGNEIDEIKKLLTDATSHHKV